MIVKAKKLWLGNVSVRDYTVRRAVDRNENLVIEYKDKVMIIPHDKILESIVAESDPMVSRFENVTYKLIDFYWKPQDQMNLL